MIVIVVFCLTVGLIVIKLYRDLASLRLQLDAARAQIDAQLALRASLLKSLQGAMRAREPDMPRPAMAPALVGTDTYSMLADLKSAEDKIEFARAFYNETARAYEVRLREFPYSLLASSLRLRPRELLEINIEQTTVA